MTLMRVWKLAATLLAIGCLPLSGSQDPTKQPMEAAPRMSVLMIIVDDLRASLDGGPDGTDLLQRPNLDLLAKRGVKFVRAYAQCALCAPSRSSVLVGMRPDTTRVFDLTTHFRAAIPSAITLPQAFKAAGYLTLGVGKVFHRGLGDGNHSWSETPHGLAPPLVDRPAYALPKNAMIDQERKSASRAAHAANNPGADILRGGKVRRGPVLEVSPRAYHGFHDNAAADWAIAALTHAAPAARSAAGFTDSDSSDYAAAAATVATSSIMPQPFFLAVGFVRPHLPWVAPEEYWDLYGSSNGTTLSGQFPLAPSAYRPSRSGHGARSSSSRVSLGGGAHELQAYAGVPDNLACLDNSNVNAHGRNNDERTSATSGAAHPATRDSCSSTSAASTTAPVTTRLLRHGYAAAASYADAQLGKVVGALAPLGLVKNTLVVVWGDHGFKLGDFPATPLSSRFGSGWGKNSNAEVDARVPLVVALPTDMPRFLVHARQQAAIMGTNSAMHVAETNTAGTSSAMDAQMGEAAQGVTSHALVELVDLFPTLLHLTGVPLSSSRIHDEKSSPASIGEDKKMEPPVSRRRHPLEGSSFARLLLNASLAKTVDLSGQASTSSSRSTRNSMSTEGTASEVVVSDSVWKEAVFSQVRRGKAGMGYSARTKRYRITIWVDVRKLGQGRGLEDAGGVGIKRASGSGAALAWDDVRTAADWRHASDENRRSQATDQASQLSSKKLKGKGGPMGSSGMQVEVFDLREDPWEENDLGLSGVPAPTRSQLLDIWARGACGAVGNRALAPLPELCRKGTTTAS